MSTAVKSGRTLLHERAASGDYEAAAALEILDAAPFRDDARAWRHVTADGIDWRGILDEGTWSTGEHHLLQLGRALWTGNGISLDITYLFTCLSGDFLQIVVDAITARRGWQPLPAPRSPYAGGYRGGFGDTPFPDGLDRDDEAPSLAECDRDEAGAR